MPINPERTIYRLQLPLQFIEHKQVELARLEHDPAGARRVAGSIGNAERC
jgi:hypothetical protein